MKRLAHYSQHFLRSPRLVKELIGHSSVKKNDTVYDIGAGSGVISAALAGRCKEVISIEAEPRTAKKLRQNMEKYPNVTVHEGDFLEMELPAAPYKVFANIPFHLSSPIVRKLTDATTPPDAMYLIVQKQFANKLLADSRHFTGQLGMLIGPKFVVRIRRPLRKTDFWPYPNVDTVFLEMTRRKQPLIPEGKMDTYRRFTFECFSSPTAFAKVSKTPPALRPSQFSLEQWVNLFNARETTR